MYKPIISKLALQAIKNLHPEVVLGVQRKTLLSPQEIQLLSTIKSTTNPQISEFEDLLGKNPGGFHFARTARCLQHQWQSLKQYSLLGDQVASHSCFCKITLNQILPSTKANGKQIIL